MGKVAIDLFCGLGGWTDGILAEGYDVIGFDIEQHVYGDQHYPAQLVLQDVMTLHGRQFKDVTLIVASPPCQNYSYMAMPWSRAKQIAGALREEVPFPEGYKGPLTVRDLNALFDACFRIQREACEAGRHIPMVVENVKGAQPWVGRAKANYGSFYLWGDVESIGGRIVRSGAVQFGEASVTAIRSGQKFNPDGTDHGQGSWFAVADSKNRGSATKTPGRSMSRDATHKWGTHNMGTGADIIAELEGRKVPGMNFHEHEKTGQPGRSFQSAAVGIKQHGSGAAWFDKALDERRKEATSAMKSLTRDDSRLVDGAKGLDGKSWVRDPKKDPRPSHGNSSARKAASAQIAKIPLPLSRHIARCYL